VLEDAYGGLARPAAGVRTYGCANVWWSSGFWAALVHAVIRRTGTVV
jgi:hypothetical protein